jgi:hypothetical protein
MSIHYQMIRIVVDAQRGRKALIPGPRGAGLPFLAVSGDMSLTPV